MLLNSSFFVCCIHMKNMIRNIKSVIFMLQEEKKNVTNSQSSRYLRSVKRRMYTLLCPSPFFCHGDFSSAQRNLFFLSGEKNANEKQIGNWRRENNKYSKTFRNMLEFYFILFYLMCCLELKPSSGFDVS